MAGCALLRLQGVAARAAHEYESTAVPFEVNVSARVLRSPLITVHTVNASDKPPATELSLLSRGVDTKWWYSCHLPGAKPVYCTYQQFSRHASLSFHLLGAFSLAGMVCVCVCVRPHPCLHVRVYICSCVFVCARSCDYA
eukprot:scpid5551/ scgid17498/ 